MSIGRSIDSLAIVGVAPANDLVDEAAISVAAFEEIMATAIKRQHEPRIVGDLLNAEINENQARSIKYQLSIAKLPLEGP